ncbi:MAG TPA: hypothetical protein VKB76_09405 [Ktedonobacterales bacterium]|nr:hypothetical protein [Ktedonobacterales bacterium]
MRRICGPAICINVLGVPIQVEPTLEAVVAGLAQGLKLSEHKGVPVTFVRFNMIRDDCWRSDAARLAHLAQRKHAKLQRAAFAPSSA